MAERNESHLLNGGDDNLVFVRVAFCVFILKLTL